MAMNAFEQIEKLGQSIVKLTNGNWAIHHSNRWNGSYRLECEASTVREVIKLATEKEN